MKLLTVAASLVALSLPSPAQGKPSSRTTQVESRCSNDRCRIYIAGRRVGSATEESGRIVIRNKRGRVIAKITPQ